MSRQVLRSHERVKGGMQYIRLARELEGVYTDLLWLADTATQLARAAYMPAAASAPEVEMVACFRECLPLEHEEPVWFTEAEYDCEEWVHCGIAEAASRDGHGPRPRDQYPPGLSEFFACPPPHAAPSELLPESTPSRSQAEVPELVPKNTSGGSEGLGLDLPCASS